MPFTLFSSAIYHKIFGALEYAVLFDRYIFYVLMGFKSFFTSLIFLKEEKKFFFKVLIIYSDVFMGC